MFGLFGLGRMTTDDSEEQLIREWAATERRNNEDIQVRMRGEYLGGLEEDLVRIRRGHRKVEGHLRDAQDRIQSLEAQLARVRLENQALRETALNIAVDRRAIASTLEFFNVHWGINAPMNTEAERQAQGGRLVLFDQAEAKRQEEKQRMEADEAKMASMASVLDEVVDRKVQEAQERSASSLNS